MTAYMKLQLALRSDSSPRTVDRWLHGARVHDTTRRRLERAARELGLYPACSSAPTPELGATSLRLEAK